MPSRAKGVEVSKAHTNRQAALNRRQITAQYAEQHAIALSGRNLEDELTIAEHKAASLERQLASIQAELCTTQAALAESNAQRDAAQADAANAGRRQAIEHVLMMQAVRRFKEMQAAHSKLSKVIRLALSPEKYHEYRKMVTDE